MAKEKNLNTKKTKTTTKKKEVVGDMFKDIQKEKQTNKIDIPSENNLTSNEIILFDAKEESKKTQTKSQTIIKENLKPFDFGEKIFLQIHKANIYSIFSSAIISPAKYIKNRAFSDTQNLDENFLFFSNGIISNIDDEQILLEINILDSERKFFHTANAIAISDLPIPISRIKNIFTANESIKKDIISTSLTADGGIIPDQLIHATFPKELSFARFSKIPVDSIKDHTINLQRFDKILGAFAFLKNYSWLLVNKTDQLTVVPVHFFYMANAVSNHSAFQKQKNEKATLFYKQLFGLQNEIEKPFLKWIFTRLNNDVNFTDSDTKDFGTIFLSSIQNKQFQSTAKRLLNDLTDSLKRKKAIQEIWQQQDSEKSFLYLFSFLRAYGNSNTEDKSVSRKDIPELITTDPFIGEYIFACLGYFYGYKLLRNFEEKIKVNDRYISNFSELTRPLSLKFELSTLFDYAIIESVYQSVFNNNLNTDSFQNIESPSIKRELIRRAMNLPLEYTFDYDEVLGKFNYALKRKSIIDDAIEQLNKLTKDIPVVSELGVYLFRNGVAKSWISSPDFLSLSENWKFIVSFKREHIIEAMRTGKINPSEIIQRINIGKQFNEF